MRPADKALTIADLRRSAHRRLPRPIFDLIDGGAEDEVSLQRNRSAFRDVTFRPRPLADVQTRDAGASIFGEQLRIPVMLAPTGAGRIADPDAELAVARAATAFGTTYVQSTVSSYLLEDVASAASRPLWYQLYLPPTREATEGLLDRVRTAGYSVLVVTIDTPVFGQRERDVRNNISIPFKVTPALVWQAMLHPRWSAEFLRGNVGLGMGLGGDQAARPKQLSLRQTESTIMGTMWPVSWDDVAHLRKAWSGPLVIKGILRPEEVDRLIAAGVDGVIVSNHGGRQLDGVPGTLEVLPSIVAAAAGRIPVMLDGGIRRGSDVVKAVALGAAACFVGRPYLYGLAAGGEAGVMRALEIMADEIDRALALLGCAAISELDPSFVAHPGNPTMVATDQTCGCNAGRS